MNRNSDIYESFKLLRESEQIQPETKLDSKNTEQPDAIPYTQQDTLMTNVLASAKQEFGADFNNIKNPMLYYPTDGDITLSGIIPEMNDAKFQFRYKVGDGAGCYVWSNPYLPISDKTIQILQKVNGVCKNWRDEISKSEDCKPSNYQDPNDMVKNNQGDVNQAAKNVDTQQQADASQAAPPAGGDMGGQQPMMERKLRRGDDIVETTRRVIAGDDLD